MIEELSTDRREFGRLGELQALRSRGRSSLGDDGDMVVRGSLRDREARNGTEHSKFEVF